ncbi:hypothetical protein ALC57_15483 [Trachymyrmex cornetzi]|uniref:C2H2-type domain-containing protein n=1 Tax=Trachymyrmex cornetzi TaxID=471704 RepID=A0A151IX26_9HYME|nr:hypothetical protein ALC57_15483 [Trachymyrmex cornetzi]
MPRRHLTELEVMHLVTLLQEGHSQRYVVNMIGVSQFVVRSIYARYEETSECQRRSGQGRRRVTQTDGISQYITKLENGRLYTVGTPEGQTGHQLIRFLVNKRFVVKEVAVLKNGSELTYYIFTCPMPWRFLTKADQSRFTWIKNLSRLIGSQLSKNTKKKPLCDRCLHYFPTSEKLSLHIVDKRTKEKYISFTKHVKATANSKRGTDCLKFRFVDSLKFLNTSLEKLVSYLDKSKLKIIRSEFSNLDVEDFDLLTLKGVFAQANNKYNASTYDPSESSTYLMYFDENNLYGWAMSESLPYGEFQWVDIERFDVMSVSSNSVVGYILEIDLAYPQSVHDAHVDFLFCPTRERPPGKRNVKLLATQRIDINNCGAKLNSTIKMKSKTQVILSLLFT